MTGTVRVKNIGDDSTTIARIRSQLGRDVEKWSDILHVKWSVILHVKRHVQGAHNALEDAGALS